jgi:hypothetical protein
LFAPGASPLLLLLLPLRAECGPAGSSLLDQQPTPLSHAVAPQMEASMKKAGASTIMMLPTYVLRLPDG